jgi:hypothetical protein
MEWYNILMSFFAGAILTNAVPHFVHGVSGDRFPTPFSSPPGRGLSSPAVNVLWAFFNLIVGYLLFNKGEVNSREPWLVVLFFIGAGAMGIMLSINFKNKHKS